MRESRKKLKEEIQRNKQLLIYELHSYASKLSHRTYEFRMGFDAVVKGANEINCDYRIFRRPELTKEWELGCAAARALIEMDQKKNEI